jgi:hypothetical protein
MPINAPSLWPITATVLKRGSAFSFAIQAAASST